MTQPWQNTGMKFIPSLLIISCLLQCKGRTDPSDLSAIDGSLVATDNPFAYFLDESSADQLVYQAECAGEEKFQKSRGDLGFYHDYCLLSEGIKLSDLIHLHYGLGLRNGFGEPISLSEKKFLIFLIDSLRTKDYRQKPFELARPKISFEDLKGATYSEDMNQRLGRLQTFFEGKLATGERLRLSNSSSTVSFDLKNKKARSWHVVSIKREKAINPDGIGIEATDLCPVSLDSVFVRSHRNGKWFGLIPQGRETDQKGFVKDYRFEVQEGIRNEGVSELRLAFVYEAENFKGRDTSECRFKFYAFKPQSQAPAQPEFESQQEPSLANRYQQVAAYFAKKSSRMHHFMWHAARNTYRQPWGPGQAVVRSIRGMNWQPPRPMVYNNATQQVDFDRTEREHPGAGEDFFHMHRRMLTIAEKFIKKWQPIPSLSEVVSARNELIRASIAAQLPASINNRINFQIAEQKRNEADLLGLLKSHTLSDIGTRLEWTIHNALHSMFSGPSTELRLRNSINPWNRALRPPFFDDAHAWNWPDYRYLGDPYASATNPLFWVIHRYVDSWVGKWLQARGYDEIVYADSEEASRCERDQSRRCYTWLEDARSRSASLDIQPWDGPTGHDPQGAHDFEGLTAIDSTVATALLDGGVFAPQKGGVIQSF